MGLNIVTEDRTTPAYLDSFVRSETRKWSNLINASRISMD